MRIAMAQMDIMWENIPGNKRKVVGFIEEARKRQADCVVFPEMTLTGFSMNVEETGARWKEQVEFFKEASLDYQITCVFGYAMPISDVILEKHPDWRHYQNRLGIVENGQFKASYAKIHPFTLGMEGEYYQGGEEVFTVPWRDTKVSAFICYDLRFPEIFQLVSDQSEIIFVIANWPGSRISQWETLLRARAMETQAFVVGVNRTGDGDGLHYNGHSVIYGPNGEQITTIQERECLVTGDIDLSMVKKSREYIPLRKDRREKLYIKLWKDSTF
ncbi:MAG: carbon-nitrogen family hydrolase [Eubacterium sp.]|nr:carbon-nitrogen family hydrolase [Eubacterium sp.]MDD7210708.1 carbon-nitrogen family hydrolase [Lachnospiraceae bacterium]MDY5496837.1 carbon-nitrogen family hydrolase [Anaerobutyricum sp.]